MHQVLALQHCRIRALLVSDVDFHISELDKNVAFQFTADILCVLFCKNHDYVLCLITNYDRT